MGGKLQRWPDASTCFLFFFPLSLSLRLLDSLEARRTDSERPDVKKQQEEGTGVGGVEVEGAYIGLRREKKNRRKKCFKKRRQQTAAMRF